MGLRRKDEGLKGEEKKDNKGSKSYSGSSKSRYKIICTFLVAAFAPHLSQNNKAGSEGRGGGVKNR